MKNTELIIDLDFKKLIPKLSNDEYKLLEKNILQHGCIDPICVWNNTIIDGHNRYSICQKHNIPFATHELDFEQREAVIDWICANQLGRRNISEGTKKYLIGKRYEMEKFLLNNPKGKNQYSKIYEMDEDIKKERDRNHRPVTAIRLAHEYQISPRSVLRYANYAKSLDKLEKEEPDMVEKTLNGDVTISQNRIIELSKQRKTSKSKNQQKSKENNKKELLQSTHKITVKDMPQYDPDAEIVSLSFTIPSWRSSLDRVLDKCEYTDTSLEAKQKLKEELNNLKFSIETMLLALEMEDL